MSKEVFLVAGIGTKAANFGTLRYIGDRFANTDTVHYIDGGDQSEGSIVATPPSIQAEKIQNQLDGSQPRETIIFSHSLGAIAAMKVIEKNSDLNIRSFAISPPLPSPAYSYDSERMRSRMYLTNRQVMIPSTSFALGENGPSEVPPKGVDVLVPPEYFDDIYAELPGFMDRIKRLTDLGLMRLLIPKEDWNTLALRIGGELKGTINIEGPHSMHAGDGRLPEVVDSIYRLATS